MHNAHRASHQRTGTSTTTSWKRCRAAFLRTSPILPSCVSKRCTNMALAQRSAGHTFTADPMPNVYNAAGNWPATSWRRCPTAFLRASHNYKSCALFSAPRCLGGNAVATWRALWLEAQRHELTTFATTPHSHLFNNTLTQLPDGVFQGLTSLAQLYVQSCRKLCSRHHPARAFFRGHFPSATTAFPSATTTALTP